LIVFAPALQILACDGIERGIMPYEKSLLAAAGVVTRSVAGLARNPHNTFVMIGLLRLIS